MERRDKLKEIDNKNCMCYYFDDIIRFMDRDTDFNILLNGKLYEEKFKNILIYDISYKTSMGAKPLRVRFNKIDGFIKIHNNIRYLVLFDYSYCDKVCDKIKYLVGEKSGIADSINHNFARIRIDSSDSSTIEKILTFHVIILIKSVVKACVRYFLTIFYFSPKDSPSKTMKDVFYFI